MLNTKRVIVLGGDGFCGWPTSLHLSNNGHEVVIVDNLSRRKIDIDLNCNSLTPIQNIETRINTWNNITENKINFYHIDVSKEYYELLNLIKEFKPDTIIHFAEQRAAPYSMKDSKCKRYTVDNNINATHNVLDCIVESELDIHLVHLGTTGVYGYSSVGMEIPEGYLDVRVDVEGQEKEMTIPYPPHPGSVYHMTKTMDALMFDYYNKNFNLKITDLHQGIVWGTETEETKYNEKLINRFDYDGDYGTVLNRFIMQAIIEHPLTVYGEGGQTRAFINIGDTVKCLKIAVDNPPKNKEKVKIFNQTTEQHNILNLAKIIASMTTAEIRFFENPRKEDLKNDLKLKCDNFMSLGLEPITLNAGLLSEICDVAYKYKDNYNKNKIICDSVWKKGMSIDRVGKTV